MARFFERERGRDRLVDFLTDRARERLRERCCAAVLRPDSFYFPLFLLSQPSRRFLSRDLGRNGRARMPIQSAKLHGLVFDGKEIAEEIRAERTIVARASHFGQKITHGPAIRQGHGSRIRYRDVHRDSQMIQMCG